MGGNATNIYHTNLRNVGLYLTLSITMITFSSKDFIKNKTTKTLLTFLGVVFLLISFILSNELHTHIQKNKEEIGSNLKTVYSLIHFIILIFILIQLYSLIT